MALTEAQVAAICTKVRGLVIGGDDRTNAKAEKIFKAAEKAHLR
jgi:hypothetical protein